MLKIREMQPVIQPEFEKECAFIDESTDEEFAKLYPFTKDVMREMIKNNPFRLSRGKNGLTMEDILAKIDRYNKALED